MKPSRFLLFFLALLFGMVAALVTHPKAVSALPEYSAQTGEPCATCHLSPSGGGPRGPRGQAWVGDGKPGVVPSLVDSLDILGIKLDVDPQDFLAGEQPIPAAQSLTLEVQEAREIHSWLSDFDGN